MAKLDNRYTLIRYIIDAPIVGIGYLVAVQFTLSQSEPHNSAASFLFTILAMVVWYLAAAFSRLYTDRRSNKYSEEIIFIIYTLIIYTVLMSSVFFFLRNYVRFNAGFFGLFLSFLFFFLSLLSGVLAIMVITASLLHLQGLSWIEDAKDKLITMQVIDLQTIAVAKSSYCEVSY